jgi:nucleoside-diphosphate kinase
MVIQATLVLIKPDGYQRSLTGAILARFENRGLVIEEIRVSRGEPALLERHYPADPAWLAAIGATTLAEYAALSPGDAPGTLEPELIGRQVREWLLEYMLSGPIVAAALRGNRAIDAVRAMTGHTLPASASPGTIRGDYSSDSAQAANLGKRSVRNLVHTSGNPTEALRELAIWFPGRSWEKEGNQG